MSLKKGRVLLNIHAFKNLYAFFIKTFVLYFPFSWLLMEESDNNKFDVCWGKVVGV